MTYIMKHKKEHLITKYYNPTYHRHIVPSYPSNFSLTKKYQEHEKRILEISVNEILLGKNHSPFHIEFIITHDVSPVCWHMILYSLENRFKRWVYHHDPISFKTLERINKWTRKTLQESDGFMEALMRLVSSNQHGRHHPPPQQHQSTRQPTRQDEFSHLEKEMEKEERISPCIEIRNNQMHFVIYQQDHFHRVEIVDFPLTSLPPFDILKSMKNEIELMQNEAQILEKQMHHLVKVIQREYPSILVSSDVYRVVDECTKGKKVFPWKDFEHVFSIVMPFIVRHEEDQVNKEDPNQVENQEHAKGLSCHLIEITLLVKGFEYLFYICSKDDLFLNLRTKYLNFNQLKQCLTHSILSLDNEQNSKSKGTRPVHASNFTASSSVGPASFAAATDTTDPAFPAGNTSMNDAHINKTTKEDSNIPQKGLHHALYTIIKSVEERPGRFFGELLLSGNGTASFTISETILYKTTCLFQLELLDLPIQELESYYLLVVNYKPLIRNLMQNLEKIDPRLHFQLRHLMDSLNPKSAIHQKEQEEKQQQQQQQFNHSLNRPETQEQPHWNSVYSKDQRHQQQRHHQQKYEKRFFDPRKTSVKLNLLDDVADDHGPSFAHSDLAPKQQHHRKNQAHRPRHESNSFVTSTINMKRSISPSHSFLNKTMDGHHHELNDILQNLNLSTKGKLYKERQKHYKRINETMKANTLFDIHFIPKSALNRKPFLNASPQSKASQV